MHGLVDCNRGIHTLSLLRLFRSCESAITIVPVTLCGYLLLCFHFCWKKNVYHRNYSSSGYHSNGGKNDEILVKQ